MKGVRRGPGRPSTQELDEIEGLEGAVLRALVHRDRRRILLLLDERPRPVHELAEHFDVSRPMVSKHLRTLRKADLVRGEQQGRERVYRTIPSGECSLALKVAQADARYEDLFETLRDRLDAA